MKSSLSNLLLVSTMLIWVIGVDSMPIMRVLGLPMTLLAFSNFVKYSNVWRKVSRFIDDGMNGEFDYYE